jgi:hypothetical protein
MKQYAYNVTVRRLRATIVAVEKSIRITYSECAFVALDIRDESAFAILPPLPCPAMQYFPTLFNEGHNFQNKRYWKEILVLIVSVTFVQNISYSKTKHK